jgi:hypothetical protein
LTYPQAAFDMYRDAFRGVLDDLRTQQQRIATLLAGIGPLLGFVSILIPSTMGAPRSLVIAVVCLLAVALVLCGIAILPIGVAAPVLKRHSEFVGVDESVARLELAQELDRAILDPRTAMVRQARSALFISALVLTGLALTILVVLAFLVHEPSGPAGQPAATTTPMAFPDSRDDR